MTLAVLNQKGGVGKTTLSVNLAAAAHIEGHRTLILDLDAQGSALDWAAVRGESSKLEGLAVAKADRALTVARFRELSQGFGVVVLDGPPRLGDVTRAAALASDVVVIPLRPGPFDWWAASETMGLLDSADGIRTELGKPPVRRLFVLNALDSRTTIGRAAIEALSQYGEVAPTIAPRVAFAEAAAAGEAVLTTAPDSAAAAEIRALWAALRAKGDGHA
ncbi:ParA family partition ATPase [Sorangium sp. So ce693]|uniref:ParA family partition ATPase n=1 Tax=Sorangium sp. So ce693 TaxID=3133318 RepID=UPI003F6425B2